MSIIKLLSFFFLVFVVGLFIIYFLYICYLNIFLPFLGLAAISSLVRVYLCYKFDRLYETEEKTTNVYKYYKMFINKLYL